MRQNRRALELITQGYDDVLTRIPPLTARDMPILNEQRELTRRG